MWSPGFRKIPLDQSLASALDVGNVGQDSLLMGRASSAIKKAFGLTTFKGTTVYQLGTVRRRLLARCLDMIDAKAG